MKTTINYFIPNHLIYSSISLKLKYELWYQLVNSKTENIQRQFRSILRLIFMSKNWHECDRSHGSWHELGLSLPFDWWVSIFTQKANPRSASFFYICPAHPSHKSLKNGLCNARKIFLYKSYKKLEGIAGHRHAHSVMIHALPGHPSLQAASWAWNQFVLHPFVKIMYLSV